MGPNPSPLGQAVDQLATPAVYLLICASKSCHVDCSIHLQRRIWAGGLVICPLLLTEDNITVLIHITVMIFADMCLILQPSVFHIALFQGLPQFPLE